MWLAAMILVFWMLSFKSAFSLSSFTFIKRLFNLSSFSAIRIVLSAYLWRRQWQPTPVLLPGQSHRRRSVVGCSPWGRKELDMTEWLRSSSSICMSEFTDISLAILILRVLGALFQKWEWRPNKYFLVKITISQTQIYTEFKSILFI